MSLHACNLSRDFVVDATHLSSKLSVVPHVQAGFLDAYRSHLLA